MLERAEGRKRDRVGPHIRRADRDADNGTEPGPERLGVADAPEILADRGVSPRFVVSGKLVVRASGGKRGGNMLRRKHAGEYGVVASLDARHVHKTRCAADQRAARKSKLGHRLPAALRKGARAVANPLATGKYAADERMRFEALELLEGRQIGILVVEMNDEADCHEIIGEVIKKRSAAGRVAERPACGVLHQPFAEILRRDLP